MDHNLAHLTVGDGIAIRIHDIHVILRIGLAHGTDLRYSAIEVTDGERCFGLAEALHDFQARRFFKLAVNLRVERLPGSGHVVNG